MRAPEARQPCSTSIPRHDSTACLAALYSAAFPSLFRARFPPKWALMASPQVAPCPVHAPNHVLLPGDAAGKDAGKKRRRRRRMMLLFPAEVEKKPSYASGDGTVRGGEGGRNVFALQIYRPAWTPVSGETGILQCVFRPFSFPAFPIYLLCLVLRVVNSPAGSPPPPPFFLSGTCISCAGPFISGALASAFPAPWSAAMRRHYGALTSSRSVLASGLRGLYPR